MAFFILKNGASGFKNKNEGKERKEQNKKNWTFKEKKKTKSRVRGGEVLKNEKEDEGAEQEAVRVLKKEK